MSKGARLKVEYEVVVKDKKGKVLSRQKGVSKSLLRAFMYYLWSKFTISAWDGYGSNYTQADIGGVSRTVMMDSVLAEGGFGWFGAVVNDDSGGLRVGTGTTAVTPADYELATKIAHGTGAGQMVYGAMTIEAVEVVGNASRFRATRVFTNNSGASITVREIGGAHGCRDTGNISRWFLYLRDVLASPSTVPDGASITVRYRFSVTA